MKLFVVFILCLLSYNQAALSVELRNGQSGEVLMFPFFNTENGWDTYINLTLDKASILKVRIRDGVDGDLVNSFNIYGFALENWRAAIAQDSSGNPFLRIAEGSCTISNELEFGGAGTDFPLGANIGSLEVYVVASFLSFEVWDSVTDCEDIAERWGTLGEWTDDPTAGLSTPFQRTISGEANLVNVQRGLATAYTAIPLSQFVEATPHTSPTDLSPNLAEAEPIAILPGGVEIIPDSGEGIDAIAMVLGLGGLSTVRNQVVTSEVIKASTDWVISYPLAGYKNYKPFTADIGGEERHCETFGLPPATSSAPVVEIPVDEATAALKSWGDGVIKGGDGIDLDPPPLIEVELVLCTAINVVSFDGVPPILISEDSPYLTKLSGVLANDTSNTLQWRLVEPNWQGVRRPVAGFRVTTFVNGTLNGGNVLANYAILQPHVRQ